MDAGRALPSLDDPVVGGAAALIGGPPGRHAWIPARGTWWTAMRVLMLFTVLTCTVGYAQKATCRDTRNWAHEYQYTRMCYSDVVALYGQEGLEQGKRPYMDYPTEYPPLIGAAMGLVSSVAVHAHVSHPVYTTENGTRTFAGYSLDTRAATFYDLTALLFAVAACVTVACTALTAGRFRIWDAALLALAPALVLHLMTNWDILAVAFAAGGLLAWSRRAPTLAGVLIGLGVVTKAYPLLFLIPLAALCLRTGRMRTFGRTLTSTLLTIVAVVLPIWLVAGYFDGTTRVGQSIWNTFTAGGDWTALIGGHHAGGTNAVLRFVDLNQQRGADWDSLAFALQWFVGVHSTAAFAPVHLMAMVVTAVALVAFTRYALARPDRIADALRLPADSGGGLVQVAVVTIDAIVALFVVIWLPTVLGSIRTRGSITVGTLNTVTAVVLLALLAALVALTLLAPVRPRLPQLLFLTVVAFLVTNKVFSPQYVLWMVPLAALARPRWRMFLVWQASEALVLLTRFMHFIYNDTNGARGIGRGWFVGAVCLRDLVLVVFAALVIREILRPELDIVRGGGLLDDPAGGVLDRAPDVRPAPRPASHEPVDDGSDGGGALGDDVPVVVS